MRASLPTVSVFRPGRTSTSSAAMTAGQREDQEMVSDRQDQVGVHVGFPRKSGGNVEPDKIG